MPRRSDDPVLRSARREALAAFGVWLAACVYTVGYCYRYGYDRDIESIRYVLGFPDWVFWGVLVPWSICTAICFGFSYCFIRDDDLGREEAESDLGSLEDALGGESEHV
jgi:hypothetical protein